MPPFTRQHYLPAVYLQQFSADGCRATRRSRIWRLDANRSTPVTIESQCGPKYFYSKLNPNGAEKTFHEIEAAYGRIAQKIWLRKPPSRRDCVGLILMMLDVHCRNIAYQNLTAGENLHAYKVRMHSMRDLMGDAGKPLSDHEFLNRWKVRLFENADHPNGLVASDNPVLFFTLDETDQLHMAIMPVTPLCCAVAFDARSIQAIGDRLSVEDGSVLNHYEVVHSYECLFAPTELAPEQRAFVRKQWKARTNDFGYVDEKVWVPRLNFVVQHLLGLKEALIGCFVAMSFSWSVVEMFGD
jgi:hypothetical protein